MVAVKMDQGNESCRVGARGVRFRKVQVALVYA